MGGEGTSLSQIAHRLQQMAMAQHQSHTASTSTSTSASKSNTKAILNRIWTRYVPNTEAFHQLLFSELPQLLLKQQQQQHNANTDTLGLLVFDSIAGLYRTKEDDNINNHDEHKNKSSMYYAKRSQDLFTIAAQLKYISDQFGVAVVVLNQVTATTSKITMNGGRDAFAPIAAKLSLVPALGLTWSNCVNHRYILTRMEEQRDATVARMGTHQDDTISSSGGGATKFVRKIRVYSSPRFSTTMEARFRIGGSGGILVL